MDYNSPLKKMVEEILNPHNPRERKNQFLWCLT